MYIGCEAEDGTEGRRYRHNLRKGQPPGTKAPAWVRIWWDEGFRQLDEFNDLHGCPNGLEDALTVLLSAHFEGRAAGRGQWVQPTPWNLLRFVFSF